MVVVVAVRVVAAVIVVVVVVVAQPAISLFLNKFLMFFDSFFPFFGTVSVGSSRLRRCSATGCVVHGTGCWV